MQCKVMCSFTNTVEKLNRRLTNFIKFIIANCLARLTGLVSDYGVEFSPVRNWFMYCPSPGLIGVDSNQQEVLVFHGRDLGTHSQFSVRFGPAPRICRLVLVSHGGADSGTSWTDPAGNSLIQPQWSLMAIKIGPASLPGPQSQSSWDGTQLLCDGMSFVFP